MEYQGVITGIGDKATNTNIIQPEYDAIINDFIIGKNTILQGLELNGNILSAGTCLLCGYRGIIEESITLDTLNYIYGEFTLGVEDTFKIVTSTTPKTENVDVREITTDGTYYLLLYVVDTELGNRIEYKLDSVLNVDGEEVKKFNYPKNAQYSTETENVLDNAVISETATTPTEIKTITNELGEEETVVATDLHLSQPNRVANTQYVHAQIDREVDYEETEIIIKNTAEMNVGTITLRRKAKYCIAELLITTPSYGHLLKNLTVPKGFYPIKDTISWFSSFYGTGGLDFESHEVEMIIKTNGEIEFTSRTVVTTFLGMFTNVGYECQ